MSLILITLVTFLALPSWVTIMRNLLLDTYLWQTKEYRIDRVMSHLKYKEGTSYRNMYFTLVKLVIFINLILFYNYPEASYLIIAVIILFLIHFIESEKFIFSFFNKKVPRPRLKSARNAMIIGFSFFFVLLPYLLFTIWLIGLPIAGNVINDLSSSFQPVTFITDVSFVEILPQMEEGVLVIPLATLVVLIISIFNVSLDLLTPFFVSTFVILTEPLALIKRRNMVTMAKSKIKRLESLKVVAITGSYGKTTTKELLFQILANKFITAKTPENNNTDVGIAQTILNSVNEDTEIFIAEMGAYRKGEIAKSTNLVPPDIAIVTGVEGQHLSLFGTIEKLFEAKYEILQGLKPDGFAILNGNNEYTVRMAEKTDREKMMYYSVNKELNLMINEDLEDEEEGTKKPFPTNSNLYARDIKLGSKGIVFKLIIGDAEYNISTNIPGIHNASNLLASIAVGIKLGISAHELVEIINDTDFEVPYLKIIPGANESRIIDDGYNVSPTGFQSGLLMLSSQEAKGKKWIVTQGLLELGTERESVYTKLAKEIIKKSNGIITSDGELANTILKKDDKFKVVPVDTPYKLKNAYLENIRSGDLVLIEGSLPGVVISAIYASSNE